MTTSRILALLAGLASAAAPAASRAGTAGFKHEKSIYTDDREAPLRAPEGVACAENGRFVVADTGNGRLLTYTWKDGALRGGTPIKLQQVPYPFRVQLDPKGNVYVLDRKVKKVARLDANGGFAGYVEPRGAPNASSAIPVSFRVDGTGNVYLLDVAGRRLLVVDASGQVTRDVPLPGEGAEFTDITVAPGERVYAVDAVGASLWVLDKGGKAFQPVARGLKDKMNFPVYAAADERGRIFVVDQHGNGIVVLGQDGSFQGRELSIGRNDGLLYYPSQLCVTPGGDAFVADRSNDRVQVFSMTR